MQHPIKKHKINLIFSDLAFTALCKESAKFSGHLAYKQLTLPTLNAVALAKPGAVRPDSESPGNFAWFVSRRR